MLRHPRTINILSEFIRCPFLFAFELDEAKLANWMTEVGGLFPIDYWIMAIDPHCPMVVRDGERQDLSVYFFLTLSKSEKLDNGPDCKSHAVSILPICDVKSRSATLYFAGQKRKVHVIGGHEEGNVLCNIAYNRSYLRKLLLCKCGFFEGDSVVRLGARSEKRDGVVPALVDAF